MPQFRPFRPGQQPTSRDLNQLREVADSSAVDWGEGLFTDPGLGGVRLALPPDRMLWIRLTGSGSGSGSGD